MDPFLLAYLVAALSALAALPPIIAVARRLDLLDRPGPRKIHSHPVPRVGGVAIACALLAAGSTVALSASDTAFLLHDAVPIAACSLFVFFIGLVDDLFTLSPPIKLCALLLAATLLTFTGVRFGPGGLGTPFDSTLGAASAALTVAWIVTVSVGMNFIDGLDGLAGGLASVAAAALATLSALTGQHALALLMLSLLGGLNVFLLFNAHPARVFMGDGGSLGIGFLIAAVSVRCASAADSLPSALAPLFVLAVPVFDALVTLVRRSVVEARSAFSAELGHVHHRLLRTGLAHPRAVLLLYGVGVIAAIPAMLTPLVPAAWALPLLCAAAAAVLALFVHTRTLDLALIVRSAVRLWSLHAQQRRLQRVFDSAQLRLRQARTPDRQRLEVLHAARALGLSRFVDRPRLEDDDGTADDLRRTVTGGPDDATLWMRLTIPGSCLDARLGDVDCAMAVEGSFESACLRLRYLGRLLDVARELVQPAAPTCATPSPLGPIPLPACTRCERTGAAEEHLQRNAHVFTAAPSPMVEEPAATTP